MKKEAETKEEESITPTILTNTVQLLQSLIDSISQVKIFKGKWSLIETKLNTLQKRLSIPIQNPLTSQLLHSLSDTCSAATSVTNLCHSLTPPEGKLKTQNDVDSISAKLDAHINDFEVLVRSGENAVVAKLDAHINNVSFSRRESIRAETRSLMTRLQIGSSESKNSALDSLLGLLQEDDKNVLIAVAQGIIPVLVKLMDSCSSYEIKERTVAAVARISTADSSKQVLLIEGLVLLTNLLRVLESGSVFAKEKSCIVLKVLSHSKENARAIVSRGGISSLLEICREGTPNSQALAAGVLRNLSVFSEIKEIFVEENAVLTLLVLCHSGTALAQENSMGCLCNLVDKDDDLKLFVVRKGGIDNLKSLWDSAPTPQNLQMVVEMVSSLASCPNIAEFLVANDFMSRVVGVLNYNVLGVRIAAAKAVYDLAYNNRSRKELGEMGCISLLVRMLDGKAFEEKEAAAKALSILMSYNGNRRIYRKEERGIVSAVMLLNPLVQNLDKRYPVLILASLVQSNKCRKQMVAAGAGVYLQKLVELDVEGAKKLVDNLERGKIWGVFARD